MAEFYNRFSRRQFLLNAGATTLGTLVLHGCTGNPPGANTPNNAAQANAASRTDLETSSANLGFLPVVDCAPLVIAKEKGFFAKHGMNVKVAKQASWGALRDNVEIGSAGGGIDGGHFQSPIPELISEGKITKGNSKIPMFILARMNTHGVGISVANKYKDIGVKADSKSLKEVFEKAKSVGEKIKCSITFPGSSIDLWLRYWLAAGGINVETDASILVIPPAQVVSSMKQGTMDIMCATDPWNARIVSQQIGFTSVTSGEIWKNHPEKVFTMRADWVDKNPKAAKALLQAVMEAQQWCDKAENKDELCKILADKNYVNAPLVDIEGRIKGKFDYGDGRVIENPSLAVKFWSSDGVSISYPFKSHDTWFLTENMRWGKIAKDTDIKKIVDKVNREDLWKEAAKSLGVTDAEIPKSTSRGIETFFDGVKFDPDNPQAYLQSLKIKQV
ncbi:MAG: ABC transporter substrate-binding protein [Scytonematopsis contorta HA4267-MV1]|jgi:nitrate/nitrite transport system substrate-binding protein|nr:ABC transporter substrate-binding protein [Scytonematopsis contorta HA4267-MV1]